MIYSPDINKICAVCQMAHKHNENEMYCDIKEEAVPINGKACKKFKYDIVKRPVRRMRRLKTDFDKEDFTL